MKAERLISLVLLLEKHNRLTATQLSQELQVTRRTIYRDIEALCMAGIPIYSESGPQGGYGLMEGYTSALDQLHTGELKALMTLSAAQFPKGSELSQRYQKAMNKIDSAIARDSRISREKEKVIIDSQQARTYGELFDKLHRGCMENRRLKVKFEFRYPVHRLRRLTITPLGLISYLQNWLLIYRVNQGIRSIGLSDIKAAELLQETFEEDDFDLHLFWEKEKIRLNDNSRRFIVRLMVPTHMTDDISSRIYMGKIPTAANPKNWINQDFSEIEMGFNSLEEARYLLLPFGASVKILSPENLKLSYLATLRAAASLYEESE